MIQPVQPFYFYHPYVSFTTEGWAFIGRAGKPTFSSQSEDDFAFDVWQLGKTAFAALGEIQSADEFDDRYAEHSLSLKMLRATFSEIFAKKKFTFTDLKGRQISPDFDELPDIGVLDVAWQVTRDSEAGTGHVFKIHYLFCCLELIEDVVIGLLSGGIRPSTLILAVNAFANFQSIESGNEQLQKARSEMAARGAAERLRRDPKQVAKKFVKECWDVWQTDPSRYSKQSDFALDVLNKVDVDASGSPIISFDTIVKKWIPAWTKSKSNPASSVTTPEA